MSEENRTPEDVQPLARPVHEDQLARPAVGEQQEVESQTEDVQPEGTQETETAQEESGPLEEEEKGLIAQAVDKAREKGLVDESMVQKAREKGLIDKADEAIDRIRNKLSDR